ncbi:dihydroorotase [Acidobacteria bacterium AH-259-L09]|nr:dihydroorotase [Acidobacteria bacterium AH-259-L09]
MTLLLKGGTVVDPRQKLKKKRDLLVEKGRVAALGEIRAKKSWEVVDARGWIVAPGFVDMHVHLREPGREDKETILTGSQAAAAGGFTSVMCMPNTQPVNDSEAITRFILERARRAGWVNVSPAGAITKRLEGEELAEIGEMVKAGVVAITDDGNPVANNQIMRRALEYAKIFDIPVVDHCEDPHLAAGGLMNESADSTRLGLQGMNRTAEELHVARDIMLSRITGARVHVAHISTKESLSWVRQAKKQGIAVTCEVTPHHFILHDGDIKNYDTNFKMKPPLRTLSDVRAMLEGLSDGTIDCIATDHAPHTRLEKETTFEEAANGIIGMETAVSLAWEFLIRRDTVSISRLVELFSTNPNRILKLGRGTLEEGAIADITVIDPNCEIMVDATKFRSKSRNCPFHGWRLHGAPVMTIVRGKVVYQRVR